MARGELRSDYRDVEAVGGHLMGRFMPGGVCKPKEKGRKSMSADFPMRTRTTGEWSRFAGGFEISRIGFASPNLGDVSRRMDTTVLVQPFPGRVARKLFRIRSILEAMGITVDGVSPYAAR